MANARRKAQRVAWAPVPLSPLLTRYDQVILDLDGCVWIGGEPTEGAADAIAALRDAGKRVAFVTNNPRRATEEYVRALWAIGVQASLADVVTVGGALQHLLAETRRGSTAFVIGTQALLDHVVDAGLKVLNGTDLATRADLVVVAGTDDLVYDDLRIASLALRRGADFLATSRDPTHPMPDGLWPGTGAILAAIEYATGRSAAIVGKPEPQLVLTALDRLGDVLGQGRIQLRRLGAIGDGPHRSCADQDLCVLVVDVGQQKARRLILLLAQDLQDFIEALGADEHRP